MGGNRQQVKNDNGYPQRYPLTDLIQLKPDSAGDADARLYPVRCHTTRHYTFSLYRILLIIKMLYFCKNVRRSDFPQNTAFWDAAESTSKCNTRQNYNKSLKNSSFGVEKFSFSLGLLFIFSWTECMNSSVSSLKSVPFGMYCRISLLAFSMAPFCQEA